MKALRFGHPPQARLDSLEVRPIPCQCTASTTFKILVSDEAAAPQPTLPADLAACPLCLAEIHDPLQRRYRYPFTNCTNCGPRWSIIRQLPYDRPRTSMAVFAMCPQCSAEYGDPADRRFHAQPIACPRCGPGLELLDGGRPPPRRARGGVGDGREAVLEGACWLERAGRISIARRRHKRGRRRVAANAETSPHRPFAVMLADLDEVRRLCEASDDEARALLRPRPPSFSCGGEAVERVRWPGRPGRAPGNPRLGVMLPYTPLHCLLLEAVGRPIVCTSGNLSEEPMAIDDRATPGSPGRRRRIADALLTHDRPIVRPVDDSVARFDAEGLQMLRRARGYAPLPIALDIPARRSSPSAAI